MPTLEVEGLGCPSAAWLFGLTGRKDKKKILE
jgi:hypothetical protein